MYSRRDTVRRFGQPDEQSAGAAGVVRAAIKEELVAGESPDKSVQQGASGAADSPERDPRLSVFGTPASGPGGADADVDVDADVDAGSDAGAGSDSEESPNARASEKTSENASGNATGNASETMPEKPSEKASDSAEQAVAEDSVSASDRTSEGSSGSSGRAPGKSTTDSGSGSGSAVSRTDSRPDPEAVPTPSPNRPESSEEAGQKPLSGPSRERAKESGTAASDVSTGTGARAGTSATEPSENADRVEWTAPSAASGSRDADSASARPEPAAGTSDTERPDTGNAPEQAAEKDSEKVAEKGAEASPSGGSGIDWFARPARSASATPAAGTSVPAPGSENAPTGTAKDAQDTKGTTAKDAGTAQDAATSQDGKGGAAASGDPRLGGQRTSGPAGDSSDQRASVAAWAATAPAPGRTAEDRGDRTDRSGDSADSGRTAAAPAAPEPARDDATTVFRAVRREDVPPATTSSSPASSSSSTPAGGDETTLLKTVRPGSAPKQAAPRHDETTVLKAVRPEARTRPAQADQPTTAFKAPTLPAPGPATDGSRAEDRADGRGDGRGDGGPALDARAGAGFGTAAPRPGTKPAPGATDPRTGRPAAPAGDREAAPKAAAPAAGVDQPTTAIRIPKDLAAAAAAGSAGPAGTKAPADPVPDQGAGKGKGADRDRKQAGPESAEERTSTFVPLRTDDAPRPGPARPAAPGRPGAAGSGAPAAGAAASTAPGAAGGSTAAPAAGSPAAAPGATAPRSATVPASLGETERTKQQPMPPRPPLDMLADLTNNPPPPPSALRTAVRRVKIWTPLVVLLAIVFVVVQMVRPLPAPVLTMTAADSYTFEGAAPKLTPPAEGQMWMAASGLGTVDSFGEQKPIPIASVTKSMTAYIILRDHPFKRGEKGKMIDIDRTAETEGQKDKTDNESTLNTVKAGDKISEYDAIAALMIPSANNIARLLARWDSGSQEAFVKKMNDTAKELGMTNTTYTDPSGLDATTVSTAEDQVKLGLKLVEIPVLRDITKLPRWTDQYGKTWPNWNTLVPFDNALGIKTGSTTAAGGNLLFAAHKMVGKTDQFIVGAVLGQHGVPILDTAIAASKKVMLETQEALTGAKVIKKGDVVGYVDDGLGGRTPVVATADVDAVGWSSLKTEIKLSDGGAKLPHEAKAGTEIGTLTVGSGASQVKVPVALGSDLASPGFGSKLTRVG
ncbi:hypothetical protein [Streptomyces sp. NPDC097619]|uniref:hypothetical protein n=1 Tax=Streptomyces sp. NPDC097619 TaxID=3157228 RepID=UPI00332B153D